MGSISEKTLRGIMQDVQAIDPNIGDYDSATLQGIMPTQDPHILQLSNGKLTLSSRAVLEYGNVSEQAWQLQLQKIVKSFVPF